MEPSCDSVTPEEAAVLLQVDRKTVDGYIRDGLLFASSAEHDCRIRRQGVEDLMWARRRPDVVLRAWTDEEINAWIEADRLTPEQEEILRRVDRSALSPVERHGR